MIITLTLNPAVDRNIEADRLVFEDRAYILSQTREAGGRGLIASRVLHSFGKKTLAMVTSGGKNGEALEQMLALAGFPFEVVRIAAEIRTNFTIIDRQGLTIKLNELGPPITPGELEKVERAVEAKLATASWLMLCGSVPPSVKPDFYCKLIRMARKRHVKTLLDTDGEALVEGIQAEPTVVAPNQQEAERLLSRALITRAHFAEAAMRIRGMGADTVLLSLGSRGAIATDGHQMVEALPPRVDAISPIGAGDAMAAAYVWAMEEKRNFTDAVRWAVAEGTASVTLPGLSVATQEQARQVYEAIDVRIR